MKNITAVEWLINIVVKSIKNLSEDECEYLSNLFQQAEEMEKQQIIDACNDDIFCDAYTIDEEDNYKLTTKGELYYNDKFNN